MLMLQRALPPRHREHRPLPAGNGRFEVRVSRDPADIADAQRLRYHVFYREMNALPAPANLEAQRDFDAFDPVCDHLLVYDRSRPAGGQVVGAYRLLRQAVAERHGGFYSADEYDLAPLIERLGAGRGFLELGRACVHPDYRANACIQLLWRGIAAYIAGHAITHMFGCASLPGIEPRKLAAPLSYLWHNHLAPPHLRVRAQPCRHVPMDMLPADAIPLRAALRTLPPLIKGYLRAGAYIGDGAVVDRQFGTTDVFILLPVARIARKYSAHFDLEEAA